MIKALLFTLLAIGIILGGALILLETAKKPKIPPKLKSPEQMDKEDEEWKN